MAQNFSFDVTTGVDLQEVDNAVNQAQKEIAQRYDFKGSKASIEFKRTEAQLRRAVTELGRSLDGPWRADEKTATLAAWMALRRR